MPDLTLSLKVTRPELTLADLELNDHTAYAVVAWGPGARVNRNSYNRSGNVVGGTLNNSIPDLAIRSVAVRILSSSQAELETRTTALLDAFEQGVYQVKDLKAGSLTTYDCMTCESVSPADPSGQAVDAWDLSQLLAKQHVYRITYPTQPIPASGPI